MTGFFLAAALTVELVCGDLGAERRFFTQALLSHARRRKRHGRHLQE